MEIFLKRHTFAENHTLGTITFDCNPASFPTVEDKVREKGKKVQNKTAIPYGRYRVSLDVVSPKFSQYPFYTEVCGGKLPRLMEVPDFTGILIHCGRTEENSSGCILLNDYNAPLDRSKEYFKSFMGILESAPDKGNIFITIEKA